MKDMGMQADDERRHADQYKEQVCLIYKINDVIQLYHT